ncbi:hypothetical protein [Ureibacillus massiliensis]
MFCSVEEAESAGYNAAPR